MTRQTQVDSAELDVARRGPLEATAAEFPEVERYELRAGPAYQFQPGRRGFLQTLGAGIVVLAAVQPASGQQRRRGGQQARRDELLSERFHISGDGVVTVFTSKVEVGQGSRTEITQAAAEELRLPVEQIRVVMADTETCPDDGGTAGSRTTPATVPRVRSAAAAAVGLLAELAAEKLGVKRADLMIADGTFRAGERQVTLAELAADSDLAEKLRVSPAGDGAKLVSLDEWRVLGTSVAKVGGRDVVTGAARYPSDIVRPNMVYGKVLRPPSYGAKLTAIDLEPARQIPGVTVVREGDFVGCTAATSWQAAQAVSALAKTAEWDRPPQIASSELFEHLKRTASARSGERGVGVDLTVRDPSREIGVEYTAAYIQHAPMEPRAAVAEWHGGNLTVWTGTQQPSRVRQELASAFRMPESRVRVIVPDPGGGFGGKHSGEAAVEAARLAQGAGRPVHLRWTREEEFTWAYFRPAGVVQVAAAIDEGGKLARWHFANYNSGQSAIDTPYRAADRRTQFLGADSPLKQGSYRALASTFNTFARESAMDELAVLAKADPLAFRLANLDSGRLRDVLVATAKKFGWDEQRGKQAEGTGVGIACGTEKGSYVAACARVEVRGQTIRVLEVCQAFECGAILNPRNLESQVAGSIVQGLGGALFEETEFAEGRIKNPDFASYRVPRLADLPQLTIALVNRPDLPSVGGSETPIIAVAPAVANAVYQAAGIRCRSLPLKLG
jgi:CO/xanthine dehydrogenase Mo-binding subunit